MAGSKRLDHKTLERKGHILSMWGYGALARTFYMVLGEEFCIGLAATLHWDTGALVGKQEVIRFLPVCPSSSASDPVQAWAVSYAGGI